MSTTWYAYSHQRCRPRLLALFSSSQHLTSGWTSVRGGHLIPGDTPPILGAAILRHAATCNTPWMAESNLPRYPLGRISVELGVDSSRQSRKTHIEMNVVYSHLIPARSRVTGERLWRRQGDMNLPTVERAIFLCSNTLVILRKEEGWHRLESSRGVCHGTACMPCTPLKHTADAGSVVDLNKMNRSLDRRKVEREAPVKEWHRLCCV